MSSKRKKNAGTVSISADNQHIFLVKLDSNSNITDFDAFRWPVESIRFKQAKAEIDEIHGMIFDNLNSLCNSTSITKE